MNKVKLKVCGMRDEKNIMEVAALQPHFMGFIFYPKSPRFIGENFELPVLFPTTIKKVGVFVNEDVDVIKAQVNKYHLDFVQLHGSESIDTCLELKEAGIKVIKAFAIDGQFDFQVTTEYEKVCDYFLFDTKGKLHGGNAYAFDWNLLAQYNQRVPFFLSGGVSASNSSGISSLKDMNLHVLDVNSGVESEPGLKDIKKIIALKAKLHGAQ